MTAAINKQIAGVYHTDITLIQSHGDFLWRYLSPNLVFTQGTFDYISARVSPGDVEGTAQLSPSGSFPDAYVQVMSKVVYGLSTADQSAVDSASSNAASVAATVVSDYQTTFGQITQGDIQNAQSACGAAAVQTPLDYVISYALGYTWSGRQENRQPPLTYAQMAAAPSLPDLLPQRPANSGSVIDDVIAYFKMVSSVAALQSQVQLGNWVVKQLLENTSAPSSVNGGMTTIDPPTGMVFPGYQVGYGIGRGLMDIQNDLASALRIITVELELQPAQGGLLSVSSANGPAFLTDSVISLGEGGLQYDLNRTLGTSDEGSITIEYPGYTLVPVGPRAWQQHANMGWYRPDPIAAAFNNSNQDVTGFKFVTPPAYNLQSLANDGNFGILTNLLISNHPSVTINYTNANFAAFRQAAPRRLVGALTLLGYMTLGDSSHRYLGTYQPGSSNSQFALMFLPQSVPVPAMLETAFVIGASISNPGVLPPGLSLIT